MSRKHGPLRYRRTGARWWKRVRCEDRKTLLYWAGHHDALRRVDRISVYLSESPGPCGLTSLDTMRGIGVRIPRSIRK